MPNPHALKLAALALVCVAACLVAIAALRWHLLSPMDAYAPVHDGTGRVIGATYTTVPAP